MLFEAYKGCPLCDNPINACVAIHEADARKHNLYDARLPEKMIWRRCAKCGHVFTETYWTEAGLEIIFSRTQPMQTAANLQFFEAHRAPAARMIETLLSINDPLERKTLLDIGCGNGALVGVATEFGLNALGVDPREEAINAGIMAHMNLTVGTTENIEGHFDFIVLADVLEHVPFPRNMLKEVSRLSHEATTILVSCPNYGSPIWNMLDQAKVNPYWFEIEHHHNFSRSGLENLLASEDFTPIRYRISERYRACMEIYAERTSEVYPLTD